MEASQALVRLEDPTSYHVMPSGLNQQLVVSQSKTEIRKQKKVLEEEDYVSVLESIIERDYFPHLPKLRAQLQYVQSTEKFDLDVLKSIYNDLYEDSDHLFPKLKVSTLSGDDLSVDERSTIIDPNHLTVSSFFERYTSEDNKSFEKIAEKNLKAFQKKFHWAYENMDHLMIEDKPTSNHKSILGVEQNAASSQKKKAGMLMLYYIGDKILSVEERQKMDKILEKHNDDVNSNSIKERMNSIENWNFRVRNQLFFQPELSDSYDTCQVPIASSSSSSGSSSNTAAGASKTGDGKTTVHRSILPAPHAPVSMDQLLLHSSTSYEIDRQNSSQLVIHSGGTTASSQTKSANFNNMPDKVIQKHNTNLANNWFLSMPPPSAGTAPTRSTYGLLSGGIASEYDSFDSDTDTESALHGKQQLQQALLSKNKRYRPVSLDTSSVQSFPMAPPTAAPLHTLTDEQLLLRYQQLTRPPAPGEMSSSIQFSLQPSSKRDVLARKLDKPSKSLGAVYGVNGGVSSGDSVSMSSTVMRSVVAGSAAAKSGHQSTRTGPDGGSTVYSSGKRKLSDLSPAAQALAMKLQKRRETL